MPCCWKLPQPLVSTKEREFRVLANLFTDLSMTLPFFFHTLYEHRLSPTSSRRSSCGVGILHPPHYYFLSLLWVEGRMQKPQPFFENPIKATAPLYRNKDTYSMLEKIISGCSWTCGFKILDLEGNSRLNIKRPCLWEMS